MKIVGLLVTGGLVWFDKVDGMVGVLLIALILGLPWPLKGGSSLVTALWPIVSSLVTPGRRRSDGNGQD